MAWRDDAKSEYQDKVLSRAPKSPFRASLSWLVHMGALSDSQSIVLERIYLHRHDLTHELLKYVVDSSQSPDVELLLEAVSIFKSLDHFWLEVEVEIGMLDKFGDVSVEEIDSGTSLALTLCLQAYHEGLEQEI